MMTSMSRDAKGNDVKNDNDIGVEKGNSTIISMLSQKTGSIKIHNHKQIAIL